MAQLLQTAFRTDGLYVTVPRRTAALRLFVIHVMTTAQVVTGMFCLDRLVTMWTTTQLFVGINCLCGTDQDVT